MKKMIMMLFAVFSLALGARAGTTVEWTDGGIVWSALANQMWLTGGQEVARVYLYVCLHDDPEKAFYIDNHGHKESDEYFLSIHEQLQDGSFDGTNPYILDALVFSPESGLESPLLPGWEPPTYFTDIPDGASFSVLFLMEYKNPLMKWEYDDGGTWSPTDEVVARFMYQGMSVWGVEDGVAFLAFPGDTLNQYTDKNLTIINPIPEPATGLLALAGIALLIRRKRK